MAKTLRWDRERVRVNIERWGREDRRIRPSLVDRGPRRPSAPPPPIPGGRDAGGYVDLGAPPKRGGL